MAENEIHGDATTKERERARPQGRNDPSFQDGLDPEAQQRTINRIELETIAKALVQIRQAPVGSE